MNGREIWINTKKRSGYNSETQRDHGNWSETRLPLELLLLKLRALDYMPDQFRSFES
jgi:hypothetical protein